MTSSGPPWLEAAFVKLKLMKMGGVNKLAEGLALVRELGMEPVLGDGVASDLGCWMEACAARHHLRNAGEMNGFLRQRAPLAADPIIAEDGKMRLGAGARLTLDETRMASVRVAHAHRAVVPPAARSAAAA